MSNEVKIAAVIVGCIAFALCTLCICTTFYNVRYQELHQQTEAARLEHGYEQRIVPGSSMPLWVKVQPPSPDRGR